MAAAELLEAWRVRRGRKRAELEARHLVAETQRILKKKRDGMPQAVVVEIEEAAAGVEAALAGDDLEALRQTTANLDTLVEQHLGFARKSTVREYSESIVVAVAIALLLRAFVIEAFQIPSGSMIPTLQIGDHIFVSKFAYGIGIPFTDKKILAMAEPHRGDVIVFKYPLGPETDYIKRVVGLPGDRVEIKRNEIFINGRPMARTLSTQPPCRYNEGPRYEGVSSDRTCERWIEQLDGKVHETIYEPDRSPQDFGPKDIPPGNVFVMGDNRDNSNDSRVWGTVPYDLIKGRALIVWWSRGPTRGEWSVSGVAEWFHAIRWRRFFQLVN
jgi:signal peptidase I